MTKKSEKRPRPSQKPRVPDQCPSGFIKYEVVSGDTIFLLSRQLGVDEKALFNFLLR
jgi:hypothetical protein